MVQFGNEAISDDGQANREPDNGSQTVHKRFTQEPMVQLGNEVIVDDEQANREPDNGSQTVHKRFTQKPMVQPGNEAIADDEQANREPNNGSQTVHKRFTQEPMVHLGNEAIADDNQANRELENGSQTIHKHLIGKDNDEESFSEITFTRLIGNQRDIILAIYKNIQMNDHLTTKELTLDDISMLSGVNKKSLKNTLFRLVSAGYITRSDQKVGRGGWVKYQINSALKNEIKNIGIFTVAKKR